MMPDLGLTQMQIGWLEEALLVGYTAMQFPGGVIGQRLGARLMFVVIGLIAFTSCLVTPLAPLVLQGSALLGVFARCAVAGRRRTGADISGFHRSLSDWFTPDKWPLVQGLQSMGLGLGASFTPPLIAWLMTAFDWRRALVWTTLPALLADRLVGVYGRNSPAEHPSVSAEELAELGAEPPASVDSAISWSRMWALMKNRDVLVAHRLLPVHELRVLPVGELVLSSI